MRPLAAGDACAGYVDAIVGARRLLAGSCCFTSSTTCAKVMLPGKKRQ